MVVFQPPFAESQNRLAEFCGIAGFDEVFARAQFGRAKFVIFEVRVRQDNDWQTGIGGGTLHEVQNGEPIYPRHFQIDEEQVRGRKVVAIGKLLLSFQIADCFLAIVDESKLMREFLPGAGRLEKPTIVLVVFRH